MFHILYSAPKQDPYYAIRVYNVRSLCMSLKWMDKWHGSFIKVARDKVSEKCAFDWVACSPPGGDGTSKQSCPPKTLASKIIWWHNGENINFDRRSVKVQRNSKLTFPVWHSPWWLPGRSGYPAGVCRWPGDAGADLLDRRFPCKGPSPEAPAHRYGPSASPEAPAGSLLSYLAL